MEARTAAALTHADIEFGVFAGSLTLPGRYGYPKIAPGLLFRGGNEAFVTRRTTPRKLMASLETKYAISSLRICVCARVQRREVCRNFRLLFSHFKREKKPKKAAYGAVFEKVNDFKPNCALSAAPTLWNAGTG
ncbi:hypothetical protein MRX96_011712 [Rhipicephalus microplus]